MLKALQLLLVVILLIFITTYITITENKTTTQLRTHLQSKVVKDPKQAFKLHFDEKLVIDQMIEEMTMDEKIGQLIFSGISGVTMSKESSTLIKKYKVGGIILFSNNLEDPTQSIKLLNQLKAENQQNKLPIFLGVDQEGGRVERLPNIKKLPSNQEIASRNSKQLSYNIGQLLGKQLYSFGFNLNFSPVLDINSNPNNPVIGDRSFGDHVEVVSKHGIQTMLGLQSENIVTTVKHFPGHGDTSVDSHFELPEIDKSLQELQKFELIPFKDAIDKGADIVMTGHILLSQIDSELPASLSKSVITDILRKKLGFSGVVMTDDMTMQAITNQFEIGESAVQSIKAGTDIILMAHDYDGLVTVYESLKRAINIGELTEERINESVRRIIQLKWDYDLVDKKVESIDIKELNELIEEVIQ